MNRQWRLAVPSSLVVMIFLVVSCAPAAPPAAAPTAAPGKPAPTAASGPAAAAPTAPAKPAAQPTAKPASLADQLYEAAKKEGKVVWWSSYDNAISEKVAGAFQKRYPGVTVETVSLQSEQRATRALAEARAGRITYDVVKISSDEMESYRTAGLLGDNSDVLVAAGVDRSKLYEGTYPDEWNVYSAAYNTNMLKPDELPKKWDDLLDPKWKGKLGVESRLRVFTSITYHWGEDRVTDYLRRLKDQNPQFERGETATATKMMAGEFPIYVTAYMANVVELAGAGKPWGFVPLDEVFSDGWTGSDTVPSKAPHPNAARLYLYWLNTPEGLQLRDSLRFRSDPRPGTGTGPAKYLEERKMTLKVPPQDKWAELNVQAGPLQRKYQQVLGLPV